MGETNGNASNTVYKDQIARQKEEYKTLMEAESEVGKMLQEAETSRREEKGQNETDPEKGEEKIKEYLADHNEGNGGDEYLVRGAELCCSLCTHKRKMNLRECHGVYIKGHPVMHELDCIQGEEENITWFGVCNGGEGLETEDIKVMLEDGIPVTGKKCQPHIVGVWMDTYEGTKIVDNGDKMDDDDENPSGCKTLTVSSFLICKHGGIISPFNSGQEREVEVGEFEEGQEAYDRVMNFKFENEINGENDDDFLYEMQEEEGIDSIMDRLKAFIPQKVDNSIVLEVYDKMAEIPILEKYIKENAEHNLEEFAKDPNPWSNGYIENQNDWGNIWFGSGSNSNMRYSGCEIIATYNALLALGNNMSEQSMVQLISSYE